MYNYLPNVKSTQSTGHNGFVVQDNPPVFEWCKNLKYLFVTNLRCMSFNQFFYLHLFWSWQHVQNNLKVTLFKHSSSIAQLVAEGLCEGRFGVCWILWTSRFCWRKAIFGGINSTKLFLNYNLSYNSWMSKVNLNFPLKLRVRNFHIYFVL